MLATSGAVTDFRGVDMSNHSFRQPYQQDVFCTALGCKADVNERYLPALMCQLHAEEVHRIVEAKRLYILDAMRESTPPRDMDRHQKRLQDQAVVYYIQFGHGIKIGTTTNLTARLKTFCVPASQVLATEPGGRELEKSRHEFFRETRVLNTEVFEDSPKIRKHIEAVRKYHGEPNITSYIAV
jgi:hypothetical protein